MSKHDKRIVEDGCLRWANEEFGSANLGNKLRTERAVAMAAEALRQPAGFLTAVYSGAALEGAYRFAQNDKVSVLELCASAGRAAAKRAEGMPYAFAPVDGSSLNLPQYFGEAEREVGSVGPISKKGTGLLMMNAVAISPLGVPLGLLAQSWWTRTQPKSKPHAKRKLEEKETRYWFSAIEAGAKSWSQANPSTRLWFQLDRGGDFREMLAWAQHTEHWITVRASHDRRTADEHVAYLWESVEQAPVIAKRSLEIPETKTRKARTAKLELRAASVSLRLKNKWTKATTTTTLNALLVREVEPPADGGEPLEWMLLTNHPINTRADAELVLFGYTQRWRVEQFHKILKSVCKVEKTQLREAAQIERWATILSAVAMRLLRLTYFARVSPNAPASLELSRSEIAALIVAKGKGTHRLSDEISIDQAITWIAELGGYVGKKSSGGPPGMLVLARGLERLEQRAQAVADVLEFVGKT